MAGRGISMNSDRNDMREFTLVETVLLVTVLVCLLRAMAGD